LTDLRGLLDIVDFVVFVVVVFVELDDVGVAFRPTILGRTRLERILEPML
jgi:hypothetical protein